MAPDLNQAQAGPHSCGEVKMTGAQAAPTARTPTRSADVTIVVATYNRAHYLPQALDSLLAQTMAARRIVVVDDGSTDATASVMEGYRGRIEYLRKENGGKARALNHVLPGVDTEFVWFFDDDDAAYPDALERLLGVLRADEALGFAFGAFDVGKSDADLLAAPARPSPYRHEDRSAAWQRLELFRECTLMMSGALLRTAAVRAVGGLNEALIRGQDYDLMLRLACRFPFRYCGGSVYVWREHEGSRGTATERHAHDDRIRTWARYNEPIGRFLLDHVPLALFSPEADAGSGGAGTRRKALIVRAWAVATKLPATYPAADLLAAFEADPTTDLDHDEEGLLERTFHHDFIAYRLPIPVRMLARLARSRPGCTALRKISRGLYWLGHEQDRHRLKTRIIVSALFLYGLSLPAALRHRLSGPRPRSATTSG